MGRETSPVKSFLQFDTTTLYSYVAIRSAYTTSIRVFVRIPLIVSKLKYCETISTRIHIYIYTYGTYCFPGHWSVCVRIEEETMHTLLVMSAIYVRRWQTMGNGGKPTYDSHFVYIRAEIANVKIIRRIV